MERGLDNFDTDKVQHGYLPTYLRLAQQIGPAGRICEIGVKHGGSLRMWQALFPRGVIVGVDHVDDWEWPAGTVKIVADQADPGLPAQVGAASPAFDLIVDDASHNGTLTRQTWESLWPLVAPGRWYVVEDWQAAFWADPVYRGMLTLAESFLQLLDRPDSDVESIEYRYGLIILARRAPPPTKSPRGSLRP